MKKLYRSQNNKVFAGVIGGLGEYFNIDPKILRLLFLLVALSTAIIPVGLTYIIAIFIVPVSPELLS